MRTRLDEDKCEELGGRYSGNLCLVEIGGEELNVREARMVNPSNDLKHFHINLEGSRDGVMSEAAREWAHSVAQEHGKGGHEDKRDDRNLPTKNSRHNYKYSKSFNYY